MKTKTIDKKVMKRALKLPVGLQSLQGVFLFAVCLYATPGHAALSAQDIQRVRAFKEMVADVDKKTMDKTISELEKTRDPQLNLQIKEAIAKTYVDIARQEKITKRQTKDWLYSMVMLNMAYLQFGGGAQDPDAASAPLNGLIRRKLKEHLPANILKDPAFHFSLE